MNNKDENLNPAGGRLLSLDVLRGFDIAVLVLIQPVLLSVLTAAEPAGGTFWHAVAVQLDHSRWQGFTFEDLIMPLFMFMSGITIPFSMSRYRSGRAKADPRFYRRLLRRFVVLWLLGMFVQGNILDLDWRTLKLYSNTLQSIAVGYVAVALLHVLCSRRVQNIVVALCFLAYIAVFAIWGGMDFTPFTNVAERIDRSVLGTFSDGGYWDCGVWKWNTDYNYSWILSSLNFIVTVYLGCLAGRILHDGEVKPMARFRRLVVWGVVLVAAGLALDPLIPIVKRLWTSSMTLFSGGLCFLLMALFYYCIDVRGWRRGLGWLRAYGMNSLVAYCLTAIDFASVVDTFLHGLRQWTGGYNIGYYVNVQTIGGALIIFLIIRYMYKHGIFLKA